MTPQEIEKMAEDFAFRWTKPPLPDEAQDALAHAFKAGAQAVLARLEKCKCGERRKVELADETK